MLHFIKTAMPVIRRAPFSIELMNQAMYLLMPMYRVMGVRIESVDERRVVVGMRKTAYSRNHLGTLHAAPLYALGESLGGIYVLYNFGHLGWVPIAKELSVDYRTRARRTAHAEATFTEEAIAALEDAVRRDGRGPLEMEVTIANEDGEVAAVVKGSYLVKGKRG